MFLVYIYNCTFGENYTLVDAQKKDWYIIYDQSIQHSLFDVSLTLNLEKSSNFNFKVYRHLNKGFESFEKDGHELGTLSRIVIIDVKELEDSFQEEFNIIFYGRPVSIEWEHESSDAVFARVECESEYSFASDILMWKPIHFHYHYAVLEKITYFYNWYYSVFEHKTFEGMYGLSKEYDPKDLNENYVNKLSLLELITRYEKDIGLPIQFQRVLKDDRLSIQIDFGYIESGHVPYVKVLEISDNIHSMSTSNDYRDIYNVIQLNGKDDFVKKRDDESIQKYGYRFLAINDDRYTVKTNMELRVENELESRKNPKINYDIGYFDTIQEVQDLIYSVGEWFRIVNSVLGIDVRAQLISIHLEFEDLSRPKLTFGKMYQAQNVKKESIKCKNYLVKVKT